MATISEALAIAVQHHQAGRLQAAEQIYRQVVAIDPNEARAWHLLGVVHAQFGRHDSAVECIRRALAMRPDWIDALDDLGKVLMAQGKFDEAATCCRRVLELMPGHAAAHNHLGLALQGQGRADEAVASYRRAIECNADLAEAHLNLGTVWADQRKFADAAASFRRAIELKPDSPLVHFNLGNVWDDLGDVEQAVACYRRALELNPGYVAARSALLCTLQYRSSVTLAELAEAHAEFERHQAAPLRTTWRRHENTRDPRRCLRLGFVSRDLHHHPVGYFLIRLLENLDRKRFATVLYNDGPTKDDLTARFQAAATAWSDTHGWPGQRLAEQIRSDGVDVLFDLAGHTAGNRLLVFARKPAPIQVTWAGYAGTTGLAAMDYILADRYEIPPQSEAYYCERMLRMPDGYLCYDPPLDAPPVSPLPALDTGHVTFAAFHNPPKITPQVVEVWSQILRQLPEARLVLKYRGMDDPSVAGRFAGLFAAHGVDGARLEFLGFSVASRLGEYQRVDVALDSFPYNGCTTTCEALWMGVPVVTCPGETFAGRASLSHLSNVGLTEMIAGDLQQYVEIAVALASDLARLASMRAGLRDRMAASPLCDGKRFAANFAEIVRGVWQDWCEK